jgi:two-component system response regulator
MRSKVILLVEDNPDDVELTLRAFEKNNLSSDVIVARDGVEALDHLLPSDTSSGAQPANQVLPELVLLDLNLPKISGLEVLRRMRAEPRTRRVPVVVLTSSQEEKDILSSYDLGANSFVQKPVDYMQFVDAARQLSVYWLELNQSPNR